MKTPIERGREGLWLQDARKSAGFSNSAKARDEVFRRTGVKIGYSVYAQYESGSRPIAGKHLPALVEVWGEAPQGQESPPAGDIAALVQVIAEQTRAITALAEAVREDRDRISPEGLRAFLDQLRSEGLLIVPETPASSGAPRLPVGASGA